MKITLLALLSSFVWVLAASAPVGDETAGMESVAPGEDDVATKLEQLSKRFSAAYVAADLETIASLYTPDAVLFPNGGGIIRGRPAIREYWDSGANRTIRLHRIESSEIRVVGDIAHDFGFYEVAGTTDGKEWGPIRGKYLIVWKCDAKGIWRMDLDMWNRARSRSGAQDD